MRIIATLLSAALVGCGGSSHELGTLTQVGVAPDELLFDVAFEPDGTPWLATSGGYYRFDGVEWVMVPNAGITSATGSRIRFDRAGGAMIAGAGTVFRFPRGGSAWEPMNSDGLLYELPIEASDGTLYSTGSAPEPQTTRRIYFRRVGETTWTDSGVDIDLAPWNPMADQSGNIWVDTWSGGGADDGVRRIHETETEKIAGVWSDRAVLGDVHKLLGTDGNNLYGISASYASNSFGEVIRWDPATRKRSDVTDGTHCGSLGEFKCKMSGSAYVSAYARAPNGDIYEMWAADNGVATTLLALDAGDDTWWPVAIDLIPGVALKVSPSSELYLVGNISGPIVAKVTR